MSLEELKKVVTEKAKLEAESIIRDALRKAEEIIKEAEEKKKKIIEYEKNRIRSELQIESKIGEARRRARIIIAEARNNLLKAVEERAINMLRNLEQPIREESLRKLVEETLKEIKEAAGQVGSLEFHVSTLDKDIAVKIIADLVSGTPYLIQFDENILGGVRVSCCNNTIVIDNTYNTRLSKALTMIAKEISKEVGS